MLAGDLYLADDPELIRDSKRAQQLTHQINTLDPTDHDERNRLLRELLGAFGENSEIRPPLQCDYGYQTTIGARSFANWGLILLDVATISIGDDVQIGPNVQLRGRTRVGRGARIDATATDWPKCAFSRVQSADVRTGESSTSTWLFCVSFCRILARLEKRV